MKSKKNFNLFKSYSRIKKEARANAILSNLHKLVHICPNCNSSDTGKTTLTDNSYACRKCDTYWSN